MRRTLSVCLVFSLACATRVVPSAAAPAALQAEERSAPPLERVVVVSIDGLRPVDCLRLATCRTMAEAGAFAPPPDGVLSVFPSVTYPAHTTIATGVSPARHGITTNLAPDPTQNGKNKDGWRWYREDVRVPTLYDLAREAGLRTALINWPVTVGARATALVPEYWRAGTSDDVKLARALATPGLLDDVARRFPRFWEGYTPPRVQDSAGVDAALTVLETISPHLTFLHVWQTDGAQHEHGPDSPEANAALANADAELARLLAALRKAPEWPNTVIVVVSDHGFARIDHALVLNVLLANAQLADRIWVITGGGSAYVYAHEPADAEAVARARALFEGMATDPTQGIARVIDRDEIAQRGGDPDAVLALEASPGFMFSRSRTGEPKIDTTDHGAHGYAPERAEMRATLLFYGPRITPAQLAGARLLDVAPTLAPWLGLTLPQAEGKPLDITLRERATR